MLFVRFLWWENIKHSHSHCRVCHTVYIISLCSYTLSQPGNDINGVRKCEWMNECEEKIMENLWLLIHRKEENERRNHWNNRYRSDILPTNCISSSWREKRKNKFQPTTIVMCWTTSEKVREKKKHIRIYWYGIVAEIICFVQHLPSTV